MKKGYKHTDLSDKKCSTSGCNNRLKERIVQTYPKADKCYSCSHPKRKENKISNAARRDAGK
jgi:hypothetical protein